MASTPFVTVSYAQSLDGRIATITGDSQWISGDETIRLAHELRRDNDAIAVGINTVLRDDPLLTCRLPDCSDPVRVVFDGSLRIPGGSQIVRTAGRVPTVVLCSRSAASRPEGMRRVDELRGNGVDVAPVAENSQSRLRIDGALTELANRGIRTVFVEGGGALITSFLRVRRVDRMVVVVAPLLIGEGVAGIGDIGVRSLSDAFRPEEVSHRDAGRDVVWDLRFSE